MAGDAALLVEDRDPAVAAELLHLAVSDAELAGELRRRGRERLLRYEHRRVAEELRALLSRVRRG